MGAGCLLIGAVAGVVAAALAGIAWFLWAWHEYGPR
jgi:hypothetical protein